VAKEKEKGQEQKVEYSVGNIISATDRLLNNIYNTKIIKLSEKAICEVWGLYDYYGALFIKERGRRFYSKFGNKSLNCEG
jgi:hypothetical protein